MTRLSFLVSRFLAAACLCFAASAFADYPQVEINTTAGKMVFELYPDKAPKTVANFLQYVKDGQYSGTIFHRVIRGFMAQGGGYDKNFKEKPTRDPIVNEANNLLKNDYGTIAMARTQDPNSAKAQFFINVRNNTDLNFRDSTRSGIGYTVFGKMISGEETLGRIEGVPTGDGGPFTSDVPQTTIMIESVKLLNPDYSKK